MALARAPGEVGLARRVDLGADGLAGGAPLRVQSRATVSAEDHNTSAAFMCATNRKSHEALLVVMRVGGVDVGKLVAVDLGVQGDGSDFVDDLCRERQE